MIEYKSLGTLKFDELYAAFSSAFSEYDIQVNRAELARMLHRRGFVPELSFGAFDNDALVSFTFNGIGTFNGLKTAYDTGTGTIKEYRGQGLASRVFEKSIPMLVKAGISQYLLEVLQHNKSAVSVYAKQGFSVTREFNYFSQQVSSLTLKSKALSSGCLISEITLSDLKNVSKWWDYAPSWQNSFESIYRKPDDFVVIGATRGNTLLGYGIIEPTTGDITQLVVEKTSRRQGVATAILKELLKRNRYSSIKLINSEISCDSITALMENNGIPLRGKQFEMVKKLT